MVDKLLLNNQLLANKKKVRQAKINIINRLVKKIRKVKQISEKKPGDTKLIRKLEKSSDILAAVKKVKSVDLLKRSLTNKKNPTSVITNGNGVPEEIARALLYAHKSVSEVTKQLKELLHLNDETNPGWRGEIFELSKRKKKFQRIDKKREVRRETKEISSRDRKRNEWLEQNTVQPESGEENQQIENEYKPKADGWKIVEADEAKRPQKCSKESSVNKVIRGNNQGDKSGKQPLLEDSISLEPVSKAVDSFFVTKTGDNYLSTAVIDRVQTEPRNEVRKERRDQSFGNSWNGSKVSKYPGESTSYTKVQSNSIMPPHSKSAREANSEELHPSWAAKRKQQAVLKFEGKKVKFEDNDETGSSSQIKNIRMNNINTKESKTIASVSTSEKLHPSWEAKQRMKPTISEFKGTKIVFNDDE